LRSLARLLLISWLFTLAVCFYGDLFQTSADPVGETPVAHEHDGYSGHSDSAQDKDVCCSIVKNLPSFFKMGNIGGGLQHLMYVLLPSIFLVQTALLVATRIRFFGTPPPGNSSPLLTTNALWPNAPPR
jgi:hypothetical protein